MNKKLKKILDKKNKSKLVCLTSYSKMFSRSLDKYCDIVLVGDSLANVVYGMKNTHQITLDMMINHAKSVRPMIKNSLLVVDMPKNSYSNKKIALKNAKRVLKETRCDAVKLESNGKYFKIIEKLVNSKIKVMGHIGYTPQYKKKFKVEGTSISEKNKLLKEASEIEKSGAFAIVLECIVSSVSKKITKSLKIPTIGIGSSIYCDGQILVTDDLLGLSGFKPKFVKKYGSIDKIIDKAILRFSRDVKNTKFPKKINSY